MASVKIVEQRASGEAFFKRSFEKLSIDDLKRDLKRHEIQSVPVQKSNRRGSKK
jgi:hypothetical protein